MPETKSNSLQGFRAAHTEVALSHLLLLLVLPLRTKAAASANIARTGCQDSCGTVPIPYPFGIGSNCSFSHRFTLECRTINDTYAPFRHNYTYRNIDLSLGQARVDMPISSQCYNSTTKRVNYHVLNASLKYFRFNNEKNKFVVIGCDTVGFINFTNHYNSYLGGCISGGCNSLDSLTNGSCSGIGCCETAIPKGTNHIQFNFANNYNNSEVYNFSRCGYAMLTEEDGFHFNTGYITTDQLLRQNTTAVIDWVIGNTTCDIAKTNTSSYACKSDYSICLNSSSGPGYLCNCSGGYQGNPYLEKGCQGLSSLSLKLSLLV